jgi:hypothetical protein
VGLVEVTDRPLRQRTSTAERYESLLSVVAP